MANEPASRTQGVPLTSGPPETILPDLPAEVADALAAAEAGGNRRADLAAVAAAHPRVLEAWAGLAEAGADAIETYAYARVGYHRGLDTLRANGWRGSGYVRWRHPANRGFLRALEALRSAAERIGEQDEEQRCALFLRQLDPDWDHRGGG